MPLRILIVDDNRDLLASYTKELLRQIRPTNSSVEVDGVDRIAVALDKLQNHQFEILVVDLKIPGPSGEEMGGLELISRSLNLDALRPIIAITGYGTVDLVRKTLRQGVFDFIEKSEKAIDDLVDSVKRAINHYDEKMLRAGNPFSAMTGVEPTIFGGRNKELEFFDERLKRVLNTKFRDHFLVLGSWGIGKSTLLKEYKKICQSHGHIAASVPLEPLKSGNTLLDAARSIIEGILRDIPYSIDQFKKLTTFFDSVGINILGTGISIKRDTTEKELSTQAFLHDTLIKLWQDLEDKTAGVLVLFLDDLDNFLAVSEIVMTLRQTLSMESIKSARILVGIASTPDTWLQVTSVSQHHPLSRFFMSQVKLGPLTNLELNDTIGKSLSGTGVSFDPNIIERVFEYTRGHPYEMQLLCYHLFNNQLSRRVDGVVWEKALQSALHDLGVAIFDRWLGQASGEEAKVLQVIASTDAALSVQDIQGLTENRRPEIPSGNIPKYLQRLAEKKLIDRPGRGLYTIPDNMFRAYLRSLSN